MVTIITLMLLFAQTGAPKTVEAVDVRGTDLSAALTREIASKITDIPVRTVDVGGLNLSVAIVHREKGTELTAMASHDKITEVYYIVEGTGTFVTGGTLVKPEKREDSSDTVKQISGPGFAGIGIEGGMRRFMAEGDMVIIPPGTPHGFIEVQGDITYIVVRIDPNQVLALR